MSTQPPTRNPGWKPAKVLQLSGEAVARELPAEGQIVTESWNRAVAVPYIVYMPERDQILMLVSCEYPSRPFVLSSFDHGRSWGEPKPLPRGQVDGGHLLGVALTYLGNGRVICNVGTDLWSSHDFGETWAGPAPQPPASNGLTAGMWDPYLVDTDLNTGEITRLAQPSFNSGVNDTVSMERALAAAEKRFTFPDVWKWRPDPEDRGLAEEWYKQESFDDWPKSMRIDKPWTEQGEPPCLAWYGANFEMPDTGEIPLLIMFGAIDGRCDIFLDGREICQQKGSPETMWNQPFYVALDKGLALGRHTMAVRVDKDCCQAGIHKPIWIFDESLRKIAELDESGLILPPHTVGRENGYTFIRFSYDLGVTWSDDIVPPSWNEINKDYGEEVALCRAANGTLVAAIRTYPTQERRATEEYKSLRGLDHFEGLAVSLSRDDGYTWSELQVLYDYGRHHPCMALLPNGDMVMTYVVRLGYPRDENDFPQFGIEGVVSHDNGETWDMGHRYILAKWSGKRKGANEWWGMSQATSTVLLPDGFLLTAYGTSYRGQPLDEAAGSSSLISPRDVGLIRWRPG